MDYYDLTELSDRLRRQRDAARPPRLRERLYRAGGAAWSTARRLARAAWSWHPLYWLRCHTVTRYHVLDLRYPGYSWGYIDPSRAMYLACFRVLVDFVEREEPRVGLRTLADYCDADSSQEEVDSVRQQLTWEREVRELYRWWTQYRGEEHALHSRAAVAPAARFNFTYDLNTRVLHLPPDPRWKEWCDEDERLERKDEEMLRRLIEARQHLWT